MSMISDIRTGVERRTGTRPPKRAGGRRGRRAVVRVRDTSGYDPWGPFLFTAPQAVRDCSAGAFTHVDGTPRSLEDLRFDLETEVMRRGPWTEEELEFRALLDRLVEEAFIEETGRYWNNSPHGEVYLVNETVKIRLAGRSFKLRKGLHLVFQCRMVRERLGLHGPFMTGAFSATADSLLCGEMTNAILGRRGPAAGANAGYDWHLRGLDASFAPTLDRLWPPDPEQTSRQDESEPAVLPPEIEVERDTRVVYLLIDVSGSMEGGPLKAAKQALRVFLRTIPVGPRLRVGLRAFNENVTVLHGSLRQGYSPEARVSLMRPANLLEAGGSTAIFRAVWRALDDLQVLVRENRTPAWYLIVLSDGEDNQGIECRYDGLAGVEALFRRVAHLRRIGVLEYLPVAYGSGVEALDRIGGTGFHAEVTDPSGIVRRFASIREHLMLGLPLAGR